LGVVVSRRRNQVSHDQCIQRLAKKLSLEGWAIEAHVKGWPKPPYINEYIPDIRARKNNNTLIIEVETDDTLYLDVAQHRAFQRNADETHGAKFLLYLAGDDGTCRLIN
jgi:Holliday junction resolvase